MLLAAAALKLLAAMALVLLAAAALLLQSLPCPGTCLPAVAPALYWRQCGAICGHTSCAPSPVSPCCMSAVCSVQLSLVTRSDHCFPSCFATTWTHRTDPLPSARYLEQRETMLSKLRDTTKAGDDEITRNLVRLARTRPDIFGSTQEEVSKAVTTSIKEKQTSGGWAGGWGSGWLRVVAGWMDVPGRAASGAGVGWMWCAATAMLCPCCLMLATLVGHQTSRVTRGCWCQLYLNVEL
jgi:hypothetical protein